MAARAPRSEVWGVVLAAGEGSRMATLTRALYGRELPKQFAALDGERTLLQQTMDRVGILVPPQRTVVVVGAGYEDLAAEQLVRYPGVEIVTQPVNVGTGNGILLPLAHVMARDPQAAVAIFPSDHHVRRNVAFMEAVERAVRMAALVESGTALLGAAAERPAVDLGWIVRGRRIGGGTDRAWLVDQFIEKPVESVALSLLGAGSLWNTMVIAGRAQALWQLARKHLPEQTSLFDRYRPLVGRAGTWEARQALYEALAPADFSRAVLQAARGLAVVPVIDSGWLDCGTPERLLAWLKESPETAVMLGRVQAAVARPGARRIVAAA